MTSISDAYGRHADSFEALVAGVSPDQWDNQSPCSDWTARDVVGHLLMMHGVMLSPMGRTLSPAATLEEDPLAAFRAARADVEAILVDPQLATTRVQTPGGEMTVEQQVHQVVSDDLVLHGWDLARATGQDDAFPAAELERFFSAAQSIPEIMRVPEAFGPGITVFGPEIPVPSDAPLQDRLLGLLGRDPSWTRNS